MTDAQRIRVEALGGLRVLRNGRELPELRQHRVLAALLTHLAVERRAPRDAVMATFWPESNSDNARHALRQALYRLRQALGDNGWLVVQGDELIAGESVLCDVVDFDAAVAASDFAAAAALYRGPFLQSVHLADVQPWEQWVDGLRVRLARTYRLTCRAWVDSCLRVDDLAGALAAAQAWVAPDPTDDEAQHRLIELLVRAGDRTGASQQYESYARLLEADGLTPLEETTALYRSLMALQGSGASRGVAGIEGSTAAETVAERARSAARLPSENKPVVPFLARLGKVRPRAATLAAAALLIALAAFFTRTRDTASDADIDMVAVVPFHVAAADPALRFMGAGIVDLANGLWVGESGLPRAVDNGAVIRAWKRAGGAGETGLPLIEARRLAERLGAARLLTGEIVASRTGIRIAARLHRVSDGKILLDEEDSGRPEDDLRIAIRLLLRIAALVQGESPDRLRQVFTDSIAAAREYLAGMAAYREGRMTPAYDALTRALDIDSTFAAAALQRAILSWSMSSAELVAIAELAAWQLRDRLSRRDRMLISSGQSLGPNYPEPSTMSERIGALQRAAAENRDRSEAWLILGRSLTAGGRPSEIPNWRERGATALDRAIALDSASVSALAQRLQLALVSDDRPNVRRYRRLLEAQSDVHVMDHPQAAAALWAAAHLLGDSTAMDTLTRHAHQFTPESRFFMLWSGVLHRLDLDVVERAEQRAPPAGNLFFRSSPVVSAIRGRVGRALGIYSERTPLGAQFLITLALVDPGYRDAARSAAEYLDVLADTSRSPQSQANAICYGQLARGLQHDTSTMRAAAQRLREVTRPTGLGLYPRVGRLGVCPLLLEAIIEQSRTNVGATPALDRLEALLRRGVGLELPGSVANLMVARWRERQGDHARALAAVERGMWLTNAYNLLPCACVFANQGPRAGGRRRHGSRNSRVSALPQPSGRSRSGTHAAGSAGCPGTTCPPESQEGRAVTAQIGRLHNRADAPAATVQSARRHGGARFLTLAESSDAEPVPAPVFGTPLLSVRSCHVAYGGTGIGNHRPGSLGPTFFDGYSGRDNSTIVPGRGLVLRWSHRHNPAGDQQMA